MSGFCVFCVSRAACKKMAEEKTPYFDKEQKRNLTPEEYSARVDALTAELFSGEMRKKQISPAFDAPQFAEEWVQLGLISGAIAHPVIMACSTKTDKKGVIKTNKKGISIISWIQYQPDAKKAA